MKELSIKESIVKPYLSTQFKIYLSALLLLFTVNTFADDSQKKLTPAPEFTHSKASEWINSKPLKLADLKGKVVLLDIWSYGCWNCYRSFPWTNDLEKRLEDEDFVVIGVHAPEFDSERDRNNVVAKAKQFKLHHPIMIDNDFSYWNALGNQYWPTFYLIDKQGKLRAKYLGETHKGDKQALKIEGGIQYLLNEETLAKK
jgi:thiol-disulfide isomerase/thioredoxin